MICKSNPAIQKKNTKTKNKPKKHEYMVSLGLSQECKFLKIFIVQSNYHKYMMKKKYDHFNKIKKHLTKFSIYPKTLG